MSSRSCRSPTSGSRTSRRSTCSFAGPKRSLRVTALSDKSDPEIRFEVFERLNKGGVTLTPQEVRACIYRGPFAEMVRDVAESEAFRSLVKLQQVHQNDGTREELVLKFFAYLHRADKYDGNVKEFLNSYMKDAAASFDVAAGKSFFMCVVSELQKVVGGPVLRDSYALTPLNQLEAILVAAGSLLQENKGIKTPKAGWLNDSVLVDFSTKGTNTKKAFLGRNQRARELLSGKPVK